MLYFMYEKKKQEIMLNMCTYIYKIAFDTEYSAPFVNQTTTRLHALGMSTKINDKLS